MRSDIITIVRKEFARFFGDRSMVFTAVIMPGLLIYMIYSLMGTGIARSLQPDTEPTTLYVEQMPMSVLTTLDTLPLRLMPADLPEDDLLARLDDEDCNAVLLCFPEKFDSLSAAYCPNDSLPAPLVRLYYNSANEASMAAYRQVSEAMQGYEESYCNRFDINREDDSYSDGDSVYRFDRATDNQVFTSMLSGLLPMMMLIMLFSGCMAVAPTSIAGEKERGTIATLLVTPLQRSHLALGKIISLSCFALLSGTSSFIGIMLSLPKILTPSGVDAPSGLFTATDIVLLLLIVLSTVLLLVALVANLSALAKDVKQASTINLPVSLLVLFVGMLPMLMPDADNSTVAFLIPLYNSIAAMTQIISHEAAPLTLLITVGCNILYALVGATILTRLFNSERVMFGK